MEDVKRRDLVIFLAKHKKQCVEKIDELCYVEPVACSENSKSCLTVWIVDRLADEAIVSAEPTVAAEFIEYPTIWKNLKYVVDQ